MAIRYPEKFRIVHVRINSRIRPDQDKFIKSFSKKKRVSEAEALRAIIDSFMMSKP